MIEGKGGTSQFRSIPSFIQKEETETKCSSEKRCPPSSLYSKKKHLGRGGGGGSGWLKGPLLSRRLGEKSQTKVLSVRGGICILSSIGKKGESLLCFKKSEEPFGKRGVVQDRRGQEKGKGFLLVLKRGKAPDRREMTKSVLISDEKAISHCRGQKNEKTATRSFGIEASILFFRGSKVPSV